MNKLFRCLMVMAFALTVTAIQADDDDDDWPGTVRPGDSFHDDPYDFLFGNHIDTHIQLNMSTKKNGDPKKLKGSFYIIFTDDQGVSLGTDPVSGLPIARHPRGTSEDHDETCGVSPNIVCKVGWHMRGRPGNAKYISHSGVNGNDHPLWMLNRAEEDDAPATGMVTPQPGSYTHFHWITTTSTDTRAGSVAAECDKSSAGAIQNEAPSGVDEVCQGWHLQIKAVREFAFKHGGETVLIRPGIDNRSHLNIIHNFNNDVVITPTRGSGGH